MYMKIFNSDIKILGDDEGFIVLKCPYCESEFKVSAKDLQDKGTEDIKQRRRPVTAQQRRIKGRQAVIGQIILNHTEMTFVGDIIDNSLPFSEIMGGDSVAGVHIVYDFQENADQDHKAYPELIRKTEDPPAPGISHRHSLPALTSDRHGRRYPEVPLTQRP